MVMKSTGRWKDIPLDKLLLNFGAPKVQTQEEMSRNLAMVRTALKAKAK